MKVIIIIQARMGSTRLPGKSLMMVKDKPLIGYVIDNLKDISCVDEIILATTSSPKDNPLARYVQSRGVSIYRGSETDVLDRYYEAAKAHQGGVIIRITGDCPLIDPRIIEQAFKKFKAGRYDYLSNTLKRTYPRGLDVEIFTFRALEEAAREATEPAEREHVTPFIYNRPDRFKLGSLTGRPDLSNHRWTVDTQEDLDLITAIIEGVEQPRTTKHILQLFKRHPELMKINAHVEQKSI
jgi:spore coat polysaccharide biosynthesis protein SpsF